MICGVSAELHHSEDVRNRIEYDCVSVLGTSKCYESGAKVGDESSQHSTVCSSQTRVGAEPIEDYIVRPNDAISPCNDRKLVNRVGVRPKLYLGTNCAKNLFCSLVVIKEGNA